MGVASWRKLTAQGEERATHAEATRCPGLTCHGPPPPSPVRACLVVITITKRAKTTDDTPGVRWEKHTLRNLILGTPYQCQPRRGYPCPSPPAPAREGERAIPVVPEALARAKEYEGASHLYAPPHGQTRSKIKHGFRPHPLLFAALPPKPSSVPVGTACDSLTICNCTSPRPASTFASTSSHLSSGLLAPRRIPDLNGRCSSHLHDHYLPPPPRPNLVPAGLHALIRLLATPPASSGRPMRRRCFSRHTDLRHVQRSLREEDTPPELADGHL